MAHKIFREKALEKLSSPDNIHELVQVTSSRSWLALLALLGLVLAFVSWSVLGELPKTVRGKGILIQSGGIAEVTLLGSGIVNQILVKEGDYIKREDTIAIVAQPELQIQIGNLREKLSYIEDKRDNLVKYDIKDFVKRELLKEKYRLEDRIYQMQGAQKNLGEQTTNLEKLFSQKVITKDKLNKVRLAYIRQQRSLLVYENELQKIKNQLIGANIPQIRELEELESQIQDLRQQIDELNVRFTLSAYVRSPYEGRVIELMTKKGRLIELGAPVVSIEVANQISSDLEAIIYVPPDEGKKVKRGMMVRVAPSTVKIEEFGYITGTVKQVSEYPSTRYGMIRVLGNEDLVNTFSKDESPIAIFVKLEPANTPSGFRWTSADGPDLEINAGTLCQANIIIDHQRPISLLFPFLRQK